MKKIDSVEIETADLFKRILTTILSIQDQVRQTPDTFEASLSVIKGIRESAYENLNQLQHAALLLKAISYLENNCFSTVKPIFWQWHPHQTHGKNEADLQAISGDGVVLLSAEATTSIKPQGTISKRMKNTLHQLQNMDVSGDKYYVVANKLMEIAANSYINKTRDTDSPLTIKVIRLP